MTHVVLSQPRPRCDRLAAQLTRVGHTVTMLPCRTLQSLADQAPVARTLASLEQWDWVIFVSPAAVGFALEAIEGVWPTQTGIALIGPGSLSSFLEQGGCPPAQPILMPASAPYDAEALISMPPFDNPAGLRILVLAGDKGRQDWIAELSRRGAHVRRETLYRSEPCAPRADQLAQLEQWANQHQEAVFVFTTRDAVVELDALLVIKHLDDWAHQQRALAQHPRIIASLRRLGWRSVRLLEPGEQSLLAAIESGNHPRRAFNDRQERSG